MNLPVWGAMPDAWIGLAGALVGAGATLAGQWMTFRRNRRDRQRTATMQIASQIRLWLIDTTHAFYEADYGQPFPAPGDIPAFPFERPLEDVSLLQSSDAQSLFDLVARRRAAELYWKHTSFLRNNEEAAEDFERDIAALYVDCTSIYRTLARRVSWNGAAVAERELDAMRKRASKPDSVAD
jgi:hypothetical protein